VTPSPQKNRSNGNLLSVRVIEDGGGSVVLEAEGELDLSTASRLGDPLMQFTEAASGVVVDLSLVSFIDSSGLAMLMKGYRSRNGSGMSIVIAPDSQVARVFGIACLDRALPVFTTRGEARKGLGAPGAAR
jgi:anti-sigma B factor antagonist